MESCGFRPSRRAVLALGGAAMLGIAGCAGSSPKNGKTRTLRIGQFPTGNSLDPWKAHVAPTVAFATYDALTHLKADGTVEPWLATSWKYTDATTFVMDLRTDVVFTDGTHFDAAAVKANIDYAKSATPSNFQAKPYLDYVASVDVVSASRVRFNLTSPDPDLALGFSWQASLMVSPALLKHPGALADSAAGSGPYVLDKSASTPNQIYVLTRNPNYWAADRWPRFEKLVVQLISDSAAAVNAARGGQVDYLWEIASNTAISGWKITPGSPSSFQGLAVFDVAGKINKPLGDVRVRQAMNYAIDRQTIFKAVLDGHGAIVASTPFGPGSLGYRPEIGSYYTYDVAKAKQLLAKAGYPNGFSVDVLNNPDWDKLAQALAGYLREVGIDVNLSDHGDDFVEQTNSGTWAMGMSLQPMSGLPFTDFTTTMTPRSAMNPRHNNDPTLNHLLARAVAAQGDEQKQLYAQLAEYAAQQAWFVVPALGSQLHASNPDVVKLIEPKRGGGPLLYHMLPAGTE